MSVEVVSDGPNRKDSDARQPLERLAEEPPEEEPEREKRATFYLLGSQPVTVTAPESSINDLQQRVSKQSRNGGLLTLHLGGEAFTTINTSMLIRVDTDIIEDDSE